MVQSRHALLALAALCLAFVPATIGPAPARPVAATDCMSGSYYVVDSQPLADPTTGQASWSFGYLQLWWSDTCQTNWARVVNGQSGTWNILVSIADNGTGRHPNQCNGVGQWASCESPMINGQNIPVCALGEVFAGSTAYLASIQQPGNRYC